MVAAKFSRYNRAKVCPNKNLFEIRDVMGKVMTYVGEDDRFRMRKLNRMFQSFYYKQTEVLNCTRALELSKMGRQFHRVTELKLDFDNFSGSTLEHINPHTFPRLLRLSLTSTGERVTMEDLKRLNHPGIRELKVDLSQPGDISAITEARFPELRKLWITIRGLIHVNSYKRMRLLPHTKLEEVTIDHVFLEDSFFNTLTSENFPNLRMLKISEDSCFMIELDDDELKEVMQCQGIILELLPNDGDIGYSFNLSGKTEKLM